jgi:mannose-6-phosphate isomerase-like protein (cupin superfamily)
VVSESEGIKGKLPVQGGGGTFNILIDEEISGAQHFSLLVNEMASGHKGKEQSHGVEHCWYILKGTGIIRMAGETYHIKPGDAVFAPIGMLHSVECTGNESLRYLVIYAPPGPEKELKNETGFSKGQSILLKEKLIVAHPLRSSVNSINEEMEEMLKIDKLKSNLKAKNRG